MKLQTLCLEKFEDEKIKKVEKNIKKRFWKRQFQTETTKPQKVFDGFFGIFLPAICFLFDPIVFRTNGGAPLAGEYKSFAYILSFVSIMTLLAFMLWGKKLKWLNGFTSGIFAAGAIISLIIGIGLFPFSLMGLIILIGVLGFTPFLTAFVYWRNAVRAAKTVASDLGSGLLARMIILAAMFAVIVPALINIKIKNGLNTLQNGNAGEIRRTAQRLKYVAPLIDFSRLYLRYDASGNRLENEENRALAESYKMLTSKEIADYSSNNFFGGD